jgi:hypothetical protein
LKKTILFSSLIILLFSCKNENGTFLIKSAENKTEASFKNDSSWTITQICNDELNVAITNHNLQNFSIHVHHQSESLHLDLNKLNIPFKTPELSWYNDQMVAITTWWSGPFSRLLFIPLKSPLKNYMYIDKDIQFADSASNIIVYVDSVFEKESMTLVAKNLISDKEQVIEINISTSLEYPYFDSLYIQNSTLFVWNKRKNKAVKLLLGNK